MIQLLHSIGWGLLAWLIVSATGIIGFNHFKVSTEPALKVTHFVAFLTAIIVFCLSF